LANHPTTGKCKTPVAGLKSGKNPGCFGKFLYKCSVSNLLAGGLEAHAAFSSFGVGHSQYRLINFV
jgi:hypothetical protein